MTTTVSVRPKSLDFSLYAGDSWSGRRHNSDVTTALFHAAETGAIRRLRGDDKVMWVIGYLWAKGHREIIVNTDLSGHI